MGRVLAHTADKTSHEFMNMIRKHFCFSPCTDCVILFTITKERILLYVANICSFLVNIGLYFFLKASILLILPDGFIYIYISIRMPNIRVYGTCVFVSYGSLEDVRINGMVVVHHWLSREQRARENLSSQRPFLTRSYPLQNQEIWCERWIMMTRCWFFLDTLFLLPKELQKVALAKKK